MAQLFSNAARSELSGAIIAGDTSFSIVDSGSEFPVANTGASAIGPSADWFKAVLQDASGIEIVFVRTHAPASTSFSDVLRGQEGTTARSFAAGSTLGLRPTAGDATGTAAEISLRAPIASPIFTGNIGVGGLAPPADHGAGGVYMKSSAIMAFAGAQGYLVSNAYYGAAWKYSANNAAAGYRFDAGSHRFMVAPTGTAGAALTWVDGLTVSNAGNVTVLGYLSCASLPSPNMTGVPIAPTAAIGTNTTQVATTAHVYASKTQLEPSGQAGPSYTLVLADAGKRVARNNAAANTTTVPPHSSVPFPVNTIIYVSQDGAGASSIVAGSGVTINTAEGLNIGGQYRMATLIKTSTDTWLSVGTMA